MNKKDTIKAKKTQKNKVKNKEETIEEINKEIDKEREKNMKFLLKTKFATAEDIDKYISSKWWRITAKQYKIPLKILKERPDIVICVLYSRGLFKPEDKLTILYEILLLKKYKKHDTLKKLYEALKIEYEYIKKEEKKEILAANTLIWLLMIGLCIWAYFENINIMLTILWIYIIIWLHCIKRWYNKRKILRDAFEETNKAEQ